MTRLLLLVGALEFSYIPNAAIDYYADWYNRPDYELCEVRMMVEARLFNTREFNLFVHGEIATPVMAMGGGLDAWTPILLDSDVRIGFHLGKATVGWEHRCAHPLIVWLAGPFEDYNLWLERIYVRWDF